MIPIHLNYHDQQWAKDVGKARWASSQKKKSRARFAGAKEVDHIDGAGGELAFCRALKLEWPASNETYHTEPDVPPNWEVRTLRNSPYVKVVPEDDDDALVVWVAGQMPSFKIMGYMRAGGAKKHKEWLRDPGSRGRAAFWVPPSRMVEINPDFHVVCGYMQDSWGDWSCAFCGKEIERVAS